MAEVLWCFDYTCHIIIMRYYIHNSFNNIIILQVAEKDLLVSSYEKKLTEAFEIIMRLKIQRDQVEQKV